MLEVLLSIIADYFDLKTMLEARSVIACSEA